MTAPVAAHRALPARSAGRSPLRGTGRLCRAILRRDRIRLSVWTISMTVFVTYFAAALSSVFDDDARAARAEIMRTPAGIAMAGPGYGLEHYTPMVAVANEGVLWIVLALAIMAILHVVRHARGEEESGRAELVRAGAVGPLAPVLATLITLAGHLALISVLGAVGTLASPDDASFVDGLGMMAGCAASALVFGAAALVASQISASSRGALGGALAVFGLAFVLRAAGDMIRLEGSALSWSSPIAWAQQMRPYVDLRWWPALLALAAAGALLLAAAALASRRDLGQGLVAARPGPARARPWLRGPLALAWRQQRAVLGWSALGLGLLWFATGTMMELIDDMAADLVADNPVVAAMFGADPSQMATAFLGTMMLFVALCAAAYGIVATIGGCRAEESAGRLEQVLAAPVGRMRWLAAQLLVALGGTTALLWLSVAALASGMRMVGMQEPSLAEHALTALAYTPATLAFAAFGAALVGWAPRGASLAWALLAVTLVLEMFGPMLDAPEALRELSVLHHVPDVYSGDAEPLPVVILAIAVGALLLAALIGFRRRGVQTR
ncbi:ABC transporter permease [Brachybacterium hainanense]|uniref:ABC transporter permease n=1 Tax=Brachybacterium hainanense TaxID=1541174 RepID=A0ABV6RCB1_9MICO